MAHLNKEMSLLDTFSPATKFETELVEHGSLTQERVVLLFKVLDEVVPQLGVYTQLMKRIRDELFEAVFTEQYTGSQEQGKNGPQTYISRLPYFTLVQRVHDTKDERAEELLDQLETVKKKLFEKQKDYEACLENIARLEDDLDKHRRNISDLKVTLAEQKDEIAEFKVSLEEERESADQMEYQLNCDVSDLREDLNNAQGQVTQLQQFKQGYDDLEAAFKGTTSDLEPPPKSQKRSVVATKKANLISNIESAVKLEEQILTVQNATIEEFDKFLEEHKVDLSRGEEDDGEEDYDIDFLEHRDMEIDRADQQLMAQQGQFQESIDAMTQELELLRQHRIMLQEQLQLLEESKPSVRKLPKNKSKESVLSASRPQTQESSLSAGLEEEEAEDPSTDPFIVQERVFSKYAVMMYTTDSNGKSFHEFKDAKYCASCGEKTVLCPHKILKQEHVFSLPPGSTQLKVSRPRVRINMEIIENVMPTASSDYRLETLSASPATAKLLPSRMSLLGPLGPLSQTSKSPGDSMPSYETSQGAAETHNVNTIQRLWDDFKTRTDLERHVSRSLNMDRVMSLMEQFSAFLLWQDENATDETFKHILDNLHVFMQERYLREDVAFLATHDLICAIQQFSTSEKMVEMFAHVLIGNYDAAVFRYLLVMGDFIEAVEWKEMADFRQFAAVIYPFLNEDDLENLQMGYTSFSENRISKTLVSEYLVYIITKYREPRFLEMEAKLLNNPGKEPAFMTEQEFMESSDQVLAVANEKLRRKLFREAELYIKDKDNSDAGVPILRLAQIVSYLEILQVMNVIKDSVAEKVAGIHDRPGSVKTATSTRMSYSSAHVEKILNMTAAWNLAQNIDRREMMRRARIRYTLDDDY